MKQKKGAAGDISFGYGNRATPQLSPTSLLGFLSQGHSRPCHFRPRQFLHIMNSSRASEYVLFQEAKTVETDKKIRTLTNYSTGKKHAGQVEKNLRRYDLCVFCHSSHAC